MAKKALVTLLAILYLGVSTGATLHFQYCMGQLVKVSLGHTDDETCHTCGMDKMKDYSKDCCTDKHQHLSADKSQPAAAHTVNISWPVVFLHPLYSTVSAPSVSKIWQLSFKTAHGPPQGLGVPVFVRNCNLRI